MNRRPFPRIAIVSALALLSCLSVSSGQAVRASAAPRPSETSETVVVPAWMAWRAFHDSLKFYSRQSVTAVNDMLAQKFGLTATEATTFMNAGESFLAALERIDADARAEVQARYGRPPAPPRNPQRRVPVFPAGTDSERVYGR